ncbi:class I SAM-dependent methyltransferase [Marinoscillum sp. MHG1-6]|uniref:class I SAM-dependent methyltransferase n=1 Tax=Marinoscillum sp. MHG1-6 TaxID=2959627 RepID=UPI0021578DA6|nr:class I SAM-dependent methyltransferase [Marinoscillum sp. MHG1-6]
MSKPTIDTPENWGKASRGYATEVAPRLMDLYVSEFLDRLEVSKESNVIEVAAGSGAMTLPLSRRVKSVLATDFSPPMLEVLESRAVEVGVQNVETALMDGQNLEVDSDRFDGALCSFGLMFFPDRNKGFKELYRVLKPGHKAVVSGWSTPDRFEAFAIFFEAIGRAIPDFPKPPSPPPVFNLADLDRFREEFKAAGFREVTTEYVTRELILPTRNEIWSMLTSGAPPIQMLFDQLGDDGQLKIQEALFKIVSERFGDGPITLKNSATLGVGVK